MSNHFGRVITAMVTPFHPGGEVDFDVARELATYLVAEGSDGLVVAGSTGEGSSLSDVEKLDLFSCVAQAVNVPVIAGSTHSNTAESVELTRRASQTGVAAILATTPAYARPNQRGIAGHLGAVAAATSLPVMIYDIPSRTGRKIAAETTIDVVREHSNVLALKDASGDVVGASRVKIELGDRFHLYSGDDAMLLAFMAVGAVGIVSVASHWAAPEFGMLVDAAVAGDWVTARRINHTLAESCEFESSEVYPNPMPTKAVLRAVGLKVGQCRLPHGPSDEHLERRAVDVVARLRATRG